MQALWSGIYPLQLLADWLTEATATTSCLRVNELDNALTFYIYQGYSVGQMWYHNANPEKRYTS